MPVKILKQRKWTDAELFDEGFRQYERKKTVVLARELPAKEAPKRIRTAWDTLVAHAGYMICYDVSDGVRHKDLDSYNHWPVEPSIFLRTYRKWEYTAPWQPNAAEKHLIELGCKPFYKVAGVWAKKLTKPEWIESKESIEPILIPPGGWIAIGVDGEPFSMTEADFRKRYDQPAVATRRRKPLRA